MRGEHEPKRPRVLREADAVLKAALNSPLQDQILSEALRNSDKALSPERKSVQNAFEAILSSLPLIGITQEDMSKENQEPYTLAGTNANYRFYLDRGEDKSGRSKRAQNLRIIKQSGVRKSQEIVLTCDGRAKLDGSNRSSRGYFEMQLEPDGHFINRNPKLVLEKVKGAADEIVASINSPEHSIDNIRGAVLKARETILETLLKQSIYLPQEIPETTLGVIHQDVIIPGISGIWDIIFKKVNFHGVGITLEHKEQRRDGIQSRTEKLTLFKNGDGHYVSYTEGQGIVFTFDKLRAKIKNPHLLFLRVNELRDAIINPRPPKRTIFEKARDLEKIRFTIKEV
ncbi:MAG: hypothetical protein Q7K55_03480 [Candidatus Levybacteria bacterium]|nr:hypothetical protein [Candidatus Levybacteria bacterium]